MTTNDPVITTINNDGVATLTLNRPHIHNAFDDTTIALMTEQLIELGSCDKVRAVVLAANGKNFSAGADMNWMKRMISYSEQQNHQDAMALATLLQTLYQLPKPTIARVQGAAFGGAVGLIACCDMAIGSKLSKFCLSEVKIGLIPATIGPYVIDAIGPRLAKRYFQTAEVFSARRARRIGLLSEAVAEDQLDDTIASLLQHLLANGPKAVSAAKQLVQDIAYQPISEALMQDTSARIATLRTSDEGQEGLSAFLEKRAPAWRENQQ